MSETEQQYRSLLDLAPGENAEIVKIGGSGPIRQRMLDMGITKGTPLSVERYAPMGDPVEIKIKGYYLAIRKNEAQHVFVK